MNSFGHPVASGLLLSQQRPTACCLANWHISRQIYTDTEFGSRDTAVVCILYLAVRLFTMMLIPQHINQKATYGYLELSY